MNTPMFNFQIIKTDAYATNSTALYRMIHHDKECVSIAFYIYDRTYVR
jgi:hypothetical protein